MSVENVKKFYEDIAKDKNLRMKLEKLQGKFNLSEKEGIGEEIAAEIVAIAGKLGYHFSEDEFKEHFSKLELSDDSLEDAAGGKINLKGTAVVAGLIAVATYLANSIAKDEREANKHLKNAEGLFSSSLGQ